MSETRSDFTALTWPDGRPKIAPVQGYAAGIPWSLHLKAYEAYSKKWSPQEALIDLEGRGCRGGFTVGELDDFIPGWRDEVEELGKLRAEVARLTFVLAQPARAQAGVAAEALASLRDVGEAIYSGATRPAIDKLWTAHVAAVRALAALGGEDG